MSSIPTPDNADPNTSPGEAPGARRARPSIVGSGLEAHIAGDSPMAALIRRHDWSTTPLGPLADWSPILLASVNLALASPYPASVCWGPDFTLIYNDAYRPLTSNKHPWALGRPMSGVWPEAWHIVGPQYESALRQGCTSYQVDVLIPIEKDGRLQDFWWTNSIMPVYDPAAGAIPGTFNVVQDVTAAVLATRQLRESEARATRILRSIGDAVVVTDTEARITRMNPVSEALTGWTLEEALGRPLEEIFYILDEETRQPIESPANHVKRSGVPRRLGKPALLVARYGVQTSIDDSAAPIVDENGTISGIVLVFRDITEQRAAERERNALAARLGQVLDVTTDSVLSIDRDWRITYMNPAAQATTQAGAEIIGKNFWESFPAAVYEDSPYLAHYYPAMEQGIPGEFEAFYPEPLNIWVQVQVRPSENGIVLFFRDVTENKREAEALRLAGAALAASEEELRWTVELSAQNPWTADARGRILNFNPGWLALTGLTREQALGEGWMQVPYPEDLSHMVKAWSHALATATPYDIEHRIRTASGEARWMRSRAFPRLDSQGTVVKWYGTTEDIDSRKRAEQALMQSEKLAAVGRLASSIAHEINNPLEALTNLLYLARNNENLEQVAEYLEVAERELRRVSLITSQTLRFHKQASRPEPTDPAELLQSVLGMYEGRLRNSGVQVESRLRASGPILCFEGEIRQVLANLVGNAIDAMHPRGGRLLFRSRRAHNWITGEPGLVITVADTGGGIPPGLCRTIFEPFITTKGAGGTGLGLWISKEIVERHGGTLRMRSRQGKGTAFAFFLPERPTGRTAATA